MKIKKLSLLLIVSVLLNTFSAYAAGFSDVSNTTPNSTAIFYLQDHGIVKGYDDGTFKPANNVNRAELLKIIIEGSKIKLDITEHTPFNDLDYTQWYAPYIEKAYAEGWINGYTDNTFKPSQTVTKVEALKIIGKAQSWQIQTANPTENWYEPYVNYAEIQKYIDDTGPISSPNEAMTRGSISEIIYRTIVNTGTSPDTGTTTSNSTDSYTNSTDFGLIASNSFEGIKLSEDLPNIFYKDEIYIIKGDVADTTSDSATVIVNSKDKTPNKYYTGKTTKNHFEIPIRFKNSGDYLIGIVPGNIGNSNAYLIHVNTDLPAGSGNSTIPNNLQNVIVSYSKDKTSIAFGNITNTLKKFTFTQKTKTITYLSRQNISSFPLTYSDFANFSAGTINYNTSVAKYTSQSPLTISSAFSTNTDKSFKAVEHSFDKNDFNEVQATLFDNLGSAKNFSFTGIAKTDIESKALVIRPDENVDQIQLTTDAPTGTYFGENIIKQGGSFTFSYTPSTNGRYIIEINNKNGAASINHPIYVGDIIPLIPDFFDLHERTSYKDNFDLNNERTKLLDLINQSRTDHGLNPVAMTTQLNTLAQNHSDDMVANHYFSHYDLNNKMPEDRRIALGISTPVDENIAKDVSIEFIHHGLMRSASHHKNILTNDWTKVGLGISLDQGELIVTEEFSANPITAEDLVKFKTDLINAVNELRQNENLSTLIETEALNKSSEQLNNKSLNSETIDKTALSKALSDNNVTGSVQLIGRVGSPWAYLLKSIVSEEPSLLDTAWKKIGVNIQTDKNGKIYTIVIVGDGN